MNTEERDTGRQLSFFQLFTEEKWKVEIPIIQRDYAQGRQKSSELRYTFLNSIYDSLANDTETLDLDFVYGNIKGDSNKSFILLDGQQRLTTLFLLHWYLAHLAKDYQTFYEVISDGKKSRFTYQLRSSSEEFCDFLINNHASVFALDQLLKPDEDKHNSLSKTISNEAHFLYSWNFDPTVQSMLVMLDSIHQIFHTEKAKQFFSKLIDDENPAITFQFFNLQEFKLSDDLYIKMNSRGVQLTPFENFKSWLQDRVEKQNIKINPKDWKHRIDVEWTNLFWERREKKKNVIDIAYYRFFKNVALYSRIKTLDDKNISEQDRKLLDAIRLDNPLTFLDYERSDFFSQNALNFIFQALEAIKLQGIVNIEEWLASIATDTFIKERVGDLLLSEKNTPTRTDSVFLFALLTFIVDEKERLNEDKVRAFQEWMRLCRNLIYNTPIDTPQRYISAIQSIKDLAPYRENIYQYILDSHPDVMGMFIAQQREEEKQKITLINTSEEWKEVILKLENHEYFYGNVSVILKYSKGANGLDLEKFKFYGNRMSRLFHESIRDHQEKLLQRAILTKGNYFPKISSNHTYCLPLSGTLRDRNENWRSVFNSDESRFLKEIIDQFMASEGNPEEQLQNAINASQQTDWKRYFIEDPEILNYCKKGMLRYNGDNEIYLMRTTRIYGRHAELRSYAFYKKHVESNIQKFKPFQVYYFENAMAPYHPCIIFHALEINNSFYNLEISYKPDSGHYEMLFKNKEENKITDEKILPLIHDFDERTLETKEVHYFKNINETLDLKTTLINFVGSLNIL